MRRLYWRFKCQRLIRRQYSGRYRYVDETNWPEFRDFFIEMMALAVAVDGYYPAINDSVLGRVLDHARQITGLPPEFKADLSVEIRRRMSPRYFERLRELDEALR